MNPPDPSALRPFRFVVLCGGPGPEREVSLSSGAAVEEALAGAGLAVRRVDLEEAALPPDLDPARDLVLPLVHGLYGEDGRLSAALASRGMTYGGSGAAASALCFDKWACKAAAARLQIPVAADRLLDPGFAPDYSDIVRHLGSPFILKPRLEGSSVGLFLVDGPAVYEGAQAKLQERIYLAEALVDGVDLTVGILGGRALGVVGIRPEGGLYDYEHKYTPGRSHYDVPARCPPQLQEQLQRWSEMLFHVCGCRDLARIDFRLSREGAPVFLEVNTLPGMTGTSLLPKAAGIAGMDFRTLVLQWAALVAERHSGQRRPVS